MEKHHIIFAGQPPVMRDPREEKRRDHRRRHKPMFKESKWARTLWKRMNRARFRNVRAVALAKGDMEHFDLHVDLPKTSGWWTW